MKRIPDRIFNLITRKGFVDEFWRLFNIRRRENPKVSRKEVFQEVEDDYFRWFGAHQFTSYNAFRHSKEFLGHFNG